MAVLLILFLLVLVVCAVLQNDGQSSAESLDSGAHVPRHHKQRQSSTGHRDTSPLLCKDLLESIDQTLPEAAWKQKSEPFKLVGNHEPVIPPLKWNHCLPKTKPTQWKPDIPSFIDIPDTRSDRSSVTLINPKSVNDFLDDFLDMDFERTKSSFSSESKSATTQPKKARSSASKHIVFAQACNTADSQQQESAGQRICDRFGHCIGGVGFGSDMKGE